jgi:hypothetical protein
MFSVFDQFDLLEPFSVAATPDTWAGFCDLLSDTDGVYLDAASSVQYQDAAGTTPAGADDPVGLIEDVCGTNDASQSTSAAQPTRKVDANGQYWFFDGVDDQIEIQIPAGGITGTAIWGFRQGTVVAGVDIPEGTYTWPPTAGYRPDDELVAFYLIDRALTASEKNAAVAEMVAAGAGDVSGWGIVETFIRAWRSNSELTSFPLIDTSNGTSFRSAWQGCSGLTSFSLLDTSNGTNFYAAWQGCSSLTSFPLLDTSNGTSFALAWRNCSGLTSFPLLDVSSGTSFLYAWQDCSSLTSIPAGMFDTWTGTPDANCFVAAWDGCSSLTAQSVENILVSIDTSGQSAPASGVDITIDYDTGTGSLSSATTTAITSLKGKGWTVTINGIAQ